MASGRFQNVFYTFMGQLRYSAYFMSSASDLDGETRDGWDKYYMARDAAHCLKQLDALGAQVPNYVRLECERIKLTYNYYLGKRDGMFYGYSTDTLSYGILSQKELYKDICRYIPSESEGLEEDLVQYNTTSLRYHFAKGEDRVESFVRNCIEYHADINVACTFATNDIEQCKRIDSTSRLRYMDEMRTRYGLHA